MSKMMSKGEGDPGFCAGDLSVKKAEERSRIWG
jgi:hypothetical protein